MITDPRRVIDNLMNVAGDRADNDTACVRSENEHSITGCFDKLRMGYTYESAGRATFFSRAIFYDVPLLSITDRWISRRADAERTPRGSRGRRAVASPPLAPFGFAPRAINRDRY